MPTDKHSLWREHVKPTQAEKDSPIWIDENTVTWIKNEHPAENGEMEEIMQKINAHILEKKNVINEIIGITIKNGYCVSQITGNGEIEIIDNYSIETKKKHDDLHEKVMHEMVDITKMSPEEFELFMGEDDGLL